MDSSGCEFLRENRRLFCLFRWTGILTDSTCKRVLARLIWFIWHIFGTGISIWRCLSVYDFTKTSNSSKTRNFTETGNFTDPSNFTEPSIIEELNRINAFVYIPFILLLLLFLGPIQDTILKKNMDSFPEILKNIQKLERMRIGENEEDNTQLIQNSDLDTNSVLYVNMDFHSAEKEAKQRRNPNQENICCKFYKNFWITNQISAFIFIVLIFISSVVINFIMDRDANDFLNEYKFFAVMFYLPLPTLTTIFVITLIKQITKLYTAIYKLEDKMFTEPESIEKVSDYLVLLHKTVKIMKNNIFGYILGINFAIFVSCAVVCSYELVETIKTIKRVGAEIDYFLPLSLILFQLIWLCRVTDDLMSNVHTNIRLRIQGLLPQLYPIHPNPPKEFSDKPFKKLELIYKSLKEWPPQVYVYGGWKVNYQLLSAIILFTFTYSIKFYSFK